MPLPANKLERNERKKRRVEGIVPLGVRIKEMNPLSVIITMKEKEFVKDVEGALYQAGLSTRYVYIPHFPAGSDRNRQDGVSDIKLVVQWGKMDLMDTKVKVK